MSAHRRGWEASQWLLSPLAKCFSNPKCDAEDLRSLESRWSLVFAGSWILGYDVSDGMYE